MTGPDRQFTLTRVVDAPRPVVWRLWTDPAELAHWFHPRGLRTPPESVQVDLREGGRYAYTMVAEDGTGATPTGGVYLEVVPPERLVFTWGGPDASGGDEVVVAVTLAERGGKTEVALTVRGVAGHPGDGFVHDGWSEALDNLAEHAATR
ncbi:MAG TPA: SRPBCC domain-containing protein [Mycobacteriales bacterium]|nr:SRPBCC domain-containing protein [Mycobacteriales bacterium]